MSRIRDYLIALAGLAILLTACRDMQPFWAILGTELLELAMEHLRMRVED
jgi:hypothetical protein